MGRGISRREKGRAVVSVAQLARVACRQCQAHAIVDSYDADDVLICGVCGHEAPGLTVPRQRSQPPIEALQ